MQPTHPLRAARQRARLSLRRLAVLAGMTHSEIVLIESGARPRPSQLARLAAALGCSPDELIPEAQR